MHCNEAMERIIDKFTSGSDRPLIAGISKHDGEIETLNRYLRGELAAVETYDQCIDRVGDPDLVVALSEIRASHQLRAEQLHNHIALLGGEPAGSSGVWGAVARLVEGGANLFGIHAALESLLNGESFGVHEYEDTRNLEPETLTFVRGHLHPEQEQTHAKIAALLEQSTS